MLYKYTTQDTGNTLQRAYRSFIYSSAVSIVLTRSQGPIAQVSLVRHFVSIEVAIGEQNCPEMALRLGETYKASSSRRTIGVIGQ